MRTVYLDNNATTRVAPEVVEAMTPYLTEFYGNPSSVHRLGAIPAEAVRTARHQVAGLFGCSDGEIVFTSCGTESNNLAIAGVLEAAPGKRHIVTTTVEHAAINRVIDRMESKGYAVTRVPVDGDGRLDFGALEDAIRDDTALVAAMWANNETGVLFPIDEIAAVTRSRRVPLLVDAVTAAGKVPIDLRKIPVDLLAISGHKLHAPKGVGVLFCREGLRLTSAMQGAGQERGRRPGTENVPGIVGMGVACELAANKTACYDTEVRRLRDRLESGLASAIPDLTFTGAEVPRVPNTSNVVFRGVSAADMLVALDGAGICASAGTACKSASGQVSGVLLAMGLEPEDAAAAIRFSLSAWTTEDDINYVVGAVPPLVAKLRGS
jgi:cysteine desulfurase